MNATRFRALIVPILLAISLAGCSSGSRLYVNPEADMTFYKRVAVVPFDNLTGERYASERVARALITELVMTNRFEVVEPGEYITALDKIGGEPNVEGKFDSEKLRAAAVSVQATGLLRGSVSEYRMQRVGMSDAPVVTFDVSMYDVATGKLVWQSSITRRGKARFPIFGGTGTRTFGLLVQQACEDLVNKLESEAF